MYLHATGQASSRYDDVRLLARRFLFDQCFSSLKVALLASPFVRIRRLPAFFRRPIDNGPVWPVPHEPGRHLRGFGNTHW